PRRDVGPLHPTCLRRHVRGARRPPGVPGQRGVSLEGEGPRQAPAGPVFGRSRPVPGAREPVLLRLECPTCGALPPSPGLPRKTVLLLLEITMQKPSVTLRFGAAHDDITVDGRTFVRGKLTRREFTFIRKVTIGALEQAGMFR